MNCLVCHEKYVSRNVNGDKFDYKFFNGIQMKTECIVDFCVHCETFSEESKEKINKSMEETIKKDKKDFFLNSLVLLILYIMSIANLFWIYSLFNAEVQEKVRFIMERHPDKINFNWHFMQASFVNYFLAGFSLWFLFYCVIVTYKAIKKINIEYQKSWNKK